MKRAIRDKELKTVWLSHTVATRNAHRYEVSSRQHSMNGQEASENVKKEQLNMAKYDPNQFISAIS